MSSDLSERTSGRSIRDRATAESPQLTKVRKRNWVLELYRSTLGKKYAMAVTGVIMMGYVFGHMVGNLKMYLGAESLNTYAEFLKDILYPILPHTGFLWIMRPILLLTLVVHVHAAWSLWRINKAARPVAYQSERDYIAANWASRTMYWTGPIVLLFIAFHLADLTFGTANPDFVSGEVYDNVVASFSRVPVALLYIVANLALGVHLFHGAWSLFQSLGVNKPRFNKLRRWFAWGFAGIVVLGNVSFPLAVLTGIVG